MSDKLLSDLRSFRDYEDLTDMPVIALQAMAEAYDELERQADEIKRLQQMVEAVHDIDFPVWSCEIDECKYDATRWRWHGKDGTGWMCVCSDHQE